MEKQHLFEQSKTFLADRSLAYKELWSRLEAIHLRLREADVRDDEFDTSLRELNTYVLMSEVYFDEGIRARIKTYLDLAREVSKLVQSFPEVRRQHYLTEDIGVDPTDFRQLLDLVKRADEARTAIMKEVRARLGAQLP